MDGALPLGMTIHTFGQLKQPIHYSVLFKAGFCFLVPPPPPSGFKFVIAVLET